MTHAESEKNVSRPLSWYNNMLTEFKKQQMGYAALAILAQSCIASAAVILLLMHQMPIAIKMVFVFVITILCMSFNGAVLAQLKSKITLNLLIISVVFSSAVIIANLF